jgi:7,8-dihydroneopterin aldolase/epimerase/oxygenase
MDIIFLNSLRIDTVIGVWDWERRIRQTLIMDIEIGTDISQAGASDDINDTVDYQAVSDRIMTFTRGSEFKLIEALGEGIVKMIMSEFNVAWMRLKINKQGVVRHVRDIGIIIERGTRG